MRHLVSLPPSQWQRSFFARGAWTDRAALGQLPAAALGTALCTLMNSRCFHLALQRLGADDTPECDFHRLAAARERSWAHYLKRALVMQKEEAKEEEVQLLASLE